jgi:hypothetical protein
MTVQNLHPESANLLRRIFKNNILSWPDGNRLSWEVFLKEIASQGMAPLLYRRIIKSKCCPGWPADLLSHLRKKAMQQAAFETLQKADLCKVLAELSRIDIHPLLLKGTPLSHTIYPAPGLRPRCDTDLLIPVSARGQVAALMEQLGYKGLYEAPSEYINSQMSYSKQGKFGFSFSYDIHWQVNNNNRNFSQKFTYNRLFMNAVTISTLGENAKTLNNVDALLLACFHRAGHFSHSGDLLIWLYDIHLLCQIITEEETSIFYDKARELKIVFLCGNAIATAKSWFGTAFPMTMNLLLQDTTRESSSMFLQSGRLVGIKNHALLELKTLSTWRERIHFLLQNAFPPTEFMLWRYDKKQKITLPWLYFKRFIEGIYVFLRK